MENPKIRFKGFTKDWEQRKLGDVAEFSKGNGYSKGDLIESGTPIILYGRLYTKYETIISEVDTYVEAKEGSVYSKGGEVIVPASGETAEDIARAATVDKSGILLGGDLNVVMPNKDINPAFLAISISNGNSQRELSKKAQGKSVVHIHNEEIRNLVIPFPNKVEQNKIVAYFANLDHLITLHQRKCEQTKKLKKYMLQKMFPQNGAKVPEIRFDGFTYDWEQRKLSDVLDIVTKRNGEKYGKEEVLSVSDEYGCINQIKFQGRSFAGEDISNYKIVDTGDIIYTRSPLKSKPYGIIKVVGDEIGIVSPLYIVNKVKEGNNSQFIYRVFDSPEKTNKYLSPLVRKGAKNTMNISNDEWLSGKIDVAPSYEEQYQIGLYFDHLDHFITLHQRKCDELKKMKKYMLQNMFI